MSRDCRVALPPGAMGLSAVCDCGISGSYSLTIFNKFPLFQTMERRVLFREESKNMKRNIYHITVKNNR